MNEKANFYKKLFVLVLPISITNLLTALVSASDAVMLGMLNQESLSAVSLATQIQFVLSLFHASLTMGTTILAAQYWGKGDQASVEKILGFATRISIWISGVFFLAAVLWPQGLMLLFTNEETLIRLGSDYLRIVSPSYLIGGISQIYLCIMKNSGRALSSTAISAAAMLLNILLNGILIFGLAGIPPLGIQGAAAATILARAAELLLVFRENQKKDVVRLRITHLVSVEAWIRTDFWKYTRAVLLNELAWGCGFTMFTVIMGHLGSDAVAANSYANIVKNLIICFCLGIAGGSGILVGNELGRGDLELAKTYGGRLMHLTLVSGIVSGIGILLLSPLVLANVDTLSATAQAYLKDMLRICSYYVIGKAINSTTVAGIFCAGGNTRFGLCCDFITMWIVIIPVGMIAAFVWKLPVMWVYFLLNLDEIVKLPAVYWNYKRYKWVKNLTR